MLHVCSQGDSEHYSVMVDRWITFASSERIAQLVKQLRAELDKLLEYKITHPGPTNWSESSKEGALMRAIIDLISREEIQIVQNMPKSAAASSAATSAAAAAAYNADEQKSFWSD